MKNKLLLILLLGLGLSSCKNDDLSMSSETKNNTTIQKKETFHTFNVLGHVVIVKQIGNNYFISDDQMISERQLNLLKNGGLERSSGKISSVTRANNGTFTYKWTNGIYYYKIESSRRAQILQAFEEIQNNSNVRFVERTNQSTYVTFKDDDSKNTSYSSHIGMETGVSMEIGLHSSQGIGTIIHETMHSLGFYHEHTRPDRDQYVVIDLSKIPHPVGSKEYYSLASQYQVQPFSVAFGQLDFESIMMYGSSSILYSPSKPTGWVGQRSGLSQGDISGLAEVYGPKITGPAQICADAIYTIIGAGSVTLENASGIATLTHLGGNQYKITKIGNGIIKVKYTASTSVFLKDIVVGNVPPKISGTERISTPGKYTYYVHRNWDNSTLEYSVIGGGGTITEQTDNSFTINVPTTNQTGMTAIYKVRIREKSSCGTSSYTTMNIGIDV